MPRVRIAAAGDLHADERVQPAGQDRPARVDAHHGDAARARVLLDDLVSHAYQCAAQIIAIEDDLL